MGRLDVVTAACASELWHEGDGHDRLLWCANGTTALTVALRAAARLHGDGRVRQVLLPSIVCPQVYVGVLAAGLVPVFVATDPFDGRYRLDQAALEQFPADDAVALIWVHQYGSVGNMDSVIATCRGKRWVLIEDAALTFGVRTDRGAAGTLGDCGILSFGEGKVVNVGYGGAVVLNQSSVTDELKPLLQEEWQQINQATSTGVETHSLTEFDRELKRLYNHRYDDLRAGACTAMLHRLLARCTDYIRPLDEARLAQALSPGALAGAAVQVARRNARADWWKDRLEMSNAPVTKVIQHPAGTYWRLNVLVEPSMRHSMLRAGLAARLPLSSWFQPLYWLVPRGTVIGDVSGEERFADSVLNLWVDGVDEWGAYESGVVRALQEKPAPARA